ncbi:hypothetical protein A3I46_02200 [Candidatus Kaiserbacteria bacterium RIFCSPLOWO2_02_FULL_54_13]|uniref:Uncharacterized protein n=1 Tax=Candidatus Kaiserbacteria bacterium RIFCSPHIGHO2_02_FULL_54_22 TaxID=1798495 RepID=A0A1F6DLT4_9BACT|nr:MAG: hypothetical protein A3C19_03215 [Candidatus Kaiserbacteria bacterium RIFCSPHIGHO2_02_FULL_54_22]OGG68291.1 MAG: hypothetical protein A3E99_01025 [Candidatus Kaiserbacteria bacterium RIFCSPHIGHO2_12_FULL_54_16]OGG83321.1 MAG: hypothetical protein A3I46_02200 [Candidatus Kaiserbacteria bacterium RIFCSPLOWO2_02_FULL_54_13]
MSEAAPKTSFREKENKVVEKYGRERFLSLKQSVSQKLRFTGNDYDFFMGGDDQTSNRIADEIIEDFNLPKNTAYPGEMGLYDSLVERGILTEEEQQFLESYR